MQRWASLRACPLRKEYEGRRTRYVGGGGGEICVAGRNLRLQPTSAAEAGFFLGLLAVRLKPCPDTNPSKWVRSDEEGMKKYGES
jgi:hypothetical protein